VTGSGDGAVDALHDIALLIAAETELDRVLARVLAAVESLLGATSASVFLRSSGGAYGRRFTTLETGQPHWQDRREEVRPGGMTDTVLREGRAITVEDLQNAPNASQQAKATRSGAVLSAPLRCQEEVIGVLYANFAEQRTFTTADLHVAETLGAYAATAVRNAGLIGAERRAVARQAALLDMARALSSSLDLHHLFPAIAQHARRLLDADEVTIHRLRPDGLFQPIQRDPPAPRDAEEWEPDQFVRETIDRGRPAVRSRPSEAADVAPHRRELLHGVEVLAAVPIVTDRECLGLISLVWRRERELDSGDVDLLETIARHAAIAAQNARAHEQAIAHARLDGAIKTAQAAAHELSQPLSVIVGYSELMELEQTEAEQLRTFATLIGRAGKEASRKLDQFRRILRFVELQFGDLDPILDLARSSEPEGGARPPDPHPAPPQDAGARGRGDAESALP
jgi:GAF domain-containing protein